MLHDISTNFEAQKSRAEAFSENFDGVRQNAMGVR